MTVMIGDAWPELRDPCDVPGCEDVALPDRRFCRVHKAPADRPSMVCQGCLTRLREPARYCGFCSVELQEAA